MSVFGAILEMKLNLPAGFQLRKLKVSSIIKFTQSQVKKHFQRVNSFKEEN